MCWVGLRNETQHLNKVYREDVGLSSPTYVLIATNLFFVFSQNKKGRNAPLLAIFPTLHHSN